MKRFDKNGDGKLDETERAAMRAHGFTDAAAAESPWIKQRETWMAAARVPILSTST